MTNLQTTDQMTLSDKLDLWLARRIRWVLTPVILLAFFIGLSVQIPQIHTMESRIEKLEADNLNNSKIINSIDKELYSLYLLETDEEKKKIMRNLLMSMETR